MFPDLGAKKLQGLLEELDLTLAIQPAKRARRSDYVRVAATTASVSFKQPLDEDELILALLTGKVPPGKRPHFRLLFDEVYDMFMAAHTLECHLEHAIMIQVHLWITIDTILTA